jgi:hypothetical protein
VHFDGEHLGLYAWNRRTLFVQDSLLLLLRGMQHGHSFKGELATHQSAFQRSPDAAVLSKETWRRASLDFFKLVGLGLRDCCSLCGPHPKVSFTAQRTSFHFEHETLVSVPSLLSQLSLKP